LDNLESVATWQTSRYLVTNHAAVPSYSLTCDTGAVLRRRANSAGGSGPDARWNGKLGMLLAAELMAAMEAAAARVAVGFRRVVRVLRRREVIARWWCVVVGG
jgi:hypothetical protein